MMLGYLRCGCVDPNFYEPRSDKLIFEPDYTQYGQSGRNCSWQLLIDCPVIFSYLFDLAGFIEIFRLLI